MKKLLSIAGSSAGFFAILPSLAATPENFQVRSAADLVAICSAVPNHNVSSAAIGFCHGYVVGVYRTLEEIQEARPSARFFCMTQNPSTRTEAINAYVSWASARSDELSKLPMEGIADCLSATYPCPAAETSTAPSSRRRMP